MARQSEKARLARRRKAAQRERARDIGLETVTFDAPAIVMAKLRGAASLHPKQTLQAVLTDALTEYANNTHQGTQDLATIAVEYWPKIRPLLPYLRALANPSSPPVRVMGRVYTHADVAPLLPIYQEMARRVRNLGHAEILPYLDALVGMKR